MATSLFSSRLSKGSQWRARRSAPSWVNRTESAARGPWSGLERLESRLLLAGNAIAAHHPVDSATDPLSVRVEVSITAGGNLQANDARLFALGKIDGIRWHELGGHGARDPQESALAGWAIDREVTVASDQIVVDQEFGDPAPIVVDFPDANLEQAIREAIGKPTGDIYDLDLLQLRTLHASRRGIVDLEGLQYTTNLQWLDLSSNQISDMTAVQGLTNLHRA